MGISQGSSRGRIWKQQIRCPAMTWRRARPPAETQGGLKKRKKPKKKHRAGTTESVKSTGRPTGVTMRMRTSPEAPEPTLPMAPPKPRSLTSPLTTHTSTSQKTSGPERAGGASIRRRNATWRRRTVTTYFLLSRGGKSLDCEAAADWAFQHLSTLYVYSILPIFLLIKVSVGFLFYFISAIPQSCWRKALEIVLCVQQVTRWKTKINLGLPLFQLVIFTQNPTGGKN